MVDAIRYSIERGDFLRAAVLWEEWSRELPARIASGEADQAEWTRAKELYQWSRDVVLCARSGFLDHLNTLHAVEAYRSQQQLR